MNALHWYTPSTSSAPFFLVTNCFMNLAYPSIYSNASRRGHKQSLDIATISEGQSQFFSVLMLAWGGIVDIDIEYEKHRWMGRDLIDFYFSDGYLDLVVIKGVPKVNIAMVDDRVKQRRPCKITTHFLLQGAFSHQYMLDPINIIARVGELSKQQKREQPCVPNGFINFSKFPGLSSTFDILWHHPFELLLVAFEKGHIPCDNNVKQFYIEENIEKD
ncbi:Sphingosine kinase 2 [Capsicum chinense]|nr:Sphingosine kinase 2 [Capsicum chinense]